MHQESSQTEQISLCFGHFKVLDQFPSVAVRRHPSPSVILAWKSDGSIRQISPRALKCTRNRLKRSKSHYVLVTSKFQISSRPSQSVAVRRHPSPSVAPLFVNPHRWLVLGPQYCYRFLAYAVFDLHSLRKWCEAPEKIIRNYLDHILHIPEIKKLFQTLE